jgi:hypothetical protein
MSESTSSALAAQSPDLSQTRRLLGALKGRLLTAAPWPQLDLDRTVVFLVALHELSPEEAEAWLNKQVETRGQVLLLDGPGLERGASFKLTGPDGLLGVGREEKALLWGKG